MENNNPTISVIVPVYNAEKYLSRCIDSILVQTFTCFELLLVDDGSTDCSGRICDEYAKRDTRIRVIHKENGGVSSARNLGLDNAKGEWICFCDSDDWLYSSNTFDLPFEALRDNFVDIIEFPYSRNGVFDKIHEQLIRGKSNVNKYYANNFHNELWGRLFSWKLVSNRRFDEDLKIGEDVFFFLLCCNSINTLFLSSNGGYRYFRNGDSVMTKTSDKLIKLQIEKYLDAISKMNVPTENIIGFYFNTVLYVWGIRKRLRIDDIGFIKRCTVSSILSSDLSINKKIRLILLRYCFLMFYYRSGVR